MNLTEYIQAQLAAFGEYALNLPWENREFYVNYLAQTYHYVDHTHQLLCLVAGNCDKSLEKIRARFIEHASEEKGHERLLKQDLHQLGVRLDQRPEMPQTRNFYEVQFFQIQHVNPMAMFGYITVLEGLTYLYSKQILRKVHAAGMGKACKFLALHEEVDQDHFPHALQFLQGLPAETQEIVKKNFEQSLVLYREVLSQAAESANRQELNKGNFTRFVAVGNQAS